MHIPKDSPISHKVPLALHRDAVVVQPSHIIDSVSVHLNLSLNCSLRASEPFPFRYKQERKTSPKVCGGQKSLLLTIASVLALEWEVEWSDG